MADGIAGTSLGDIFWQVFDFGDVKEGTASEVFRKTVGVKVEADFDGVLADERHVMIGDVVVRAIGQTDAERLEGLGLKQFPELFSCNHAVRIAECRPPFNHGAMKWRGGSEDDEQGGATRILPACHCPAVEWRAPEGIK